MKTHSDLIDQLLMPEHVQDELIVKFKEEVASDPSAFIKASPTAHKKARTTIRKDFKEIVGLQLVRLTQNKDLRQAFYSYFTDPNIEYAEPNYIVRATATPDDPYFGNFWELHNTGQTGGTIDADIDALEAWSLTTGSDGVLEYWFRL